jgi:septum formation protein
MDSVVPRLILASSSPRRITLLRELGIDFSAVAPDVDEEVKAGEPPRKAAVRLALEKATTVSKDYPLSAVIGADTLVLLKEEILGKPGDEQEAQKMLERLGGKEHTVITGVALVRDGGRFHLTGAAKTKVTMKPLTQEEIAWYIQTGEPMDKAGAYALQGKGAIFIERIRGCYTNVIGLPLPTLGKMLKKAGIELW